MSGLEVDGWSFTPTEGRRVLLGVFSPHRPKPAACVRRGRYVWHTFEDEPTLNLLATGPEIDLSNYEVEQEFLFHSMKLEQPSHSKKGEGVGDGT
ncbi:MAG: hypothetical protein KKA81_16650 [Bacteroidetes bacterium]|nr:hypothetical protein [Bacteroidota bacterium]